MKRTPPPNAPPAPRPQPRRRRPLEPAIAALITASAAAELKEALDFHALAAHEWRTNSTPETRSALTDALREVAIARDALQEAPHG